MTPEQLLLVTHRLILVPTKLNTAALQLLLYVPEAGLRCRNTKNSFSLCLSWSSDGDCDISGDLCWQPAALQEQACRKAILAGNGEEFMRVVLEWIETCSHMYWFLSRTLFLLSFFTRISSSYSSPPACAPAWLMAFIQRWWRGKRWPFTSSSWSLTAAVALTKWLLCVTVRGRPQICGRDRLPLLSVYFLICLCKCIKWDKYEKNIFSQSAVYCLCRHWPLLFEICRLMTMQTVSDLFCFFPHMLNGILILLFFGNISRK